ncbi:MAG TPA: signal peptide peptidase SppA, partial [Candidatus Nanoarchaeia archaeon]|nr:signal peptide peptidase SppA [Candidatus Nanoarchaeia archaeon]
LGMSALSSTNIIKFIKEADENKQIKVILLEINSPGGSAVASDEIASAVKLTEKPVISLIREVGASGGYWIASATEHIIANRMSITGSIGVISSYLEFSGLMEEYGVSYERLVAGENKDLGNPYRKLETKDRQILQSKLDRIHRFFIQEVAVNRDLNLDLVEDLATGEFYLGIEAIDLGLIDQLGDKTTAETYIQETYHLESIDYVKYEVKPGFFSAITGVAADFFFRIGEGIGSVFTNQPVRLMLT